MEVVTIKKKFALALIAYAVLGILAWTTLSDEPIRDLQRECEDCGPGRCWSWGCLLFEAALYYWRTRIEEERSAAQAADCFERMLDLG